MSNKSISEALAVIQRKVNEQRMKNAESNWNAIRSIKEADEDTFENWMKNHKNRDYQAHANGVTAPGYSPKDSRQIRDKAWGEYKQQKALNVPEPGYSGASGEVLSKSLSGDEKAGEIEQPKNSVADYVAQQRAKMLNTDPEAEKRSIAGTPGADPVPKPDSAPKPAPAAAPAPAAPAPKMPGTSGATMPKTVPGAGAMASGFGLSGPTSTQGSVASVPKPAPAPAPRPAPVKQAQSTPVAAAPAKPDYGFAAPGSYEDTPANFFAADKRMQAANAGSQEEEESGGKTKGKKPMKESTSLMDAVLGLIGQENMFEAAKKMKGKCSSCGKMPCQCGGDIKEELKGNQKKIDANHNGKVDAQDFKILRGKKKMEEESSSDPDMAAPRPGGEKKKGDIEFKPQEAPKSPIEAPKDAPMPPKKPAGLKESIGFSDAELSHIASIMEADAPAKAPVDGNKNYKVNAKGNEVGTGPTAGDLTDETKIDEARGRPKGSSKADVNPNTEHGRDPRQHIQVIAGQAAGGRVMDFKHENGEVSKISPGMGRKIISHLGNLKPAEKQTAVLKMHKHAEGLKV